MLWHLLSLDAPTVAVVWTLFAAWCAGVQLPPADPLAMFLAVWMLYASDRLLDAQPPMGLAEPSELEERHRFHHRHRQRFLLVLVLSCLPLALLLHRLAAPVLHLYAILACLLVAWLLLVHLRGAKDGVKRKLPKELAVGLFFPAAVWIPTVARAPSMHLVLLPGAMLFGGVCACNCLFLYAWEHPRDLGRAHVTTRLAVANLRALSSALLAVCLLLAAHVLTAKSGAWPMAHPLGMPIACALSIALLLLLHGYRSRSSTLALRSLADLALLTPLIFLLPRVVPFLR